MKKKLLGLLAVTALVLLGLSTEAEAQDYSLDSGVFFSPVSPDGGSVLDRLYTQQQVYEETQRRREVEGEEQQDDKEYIERTQRVREVEEPPPPPPPMQHRVGPGSRYDPDMPGQGSIRLGWLGVNHAKDERPTSVPTVGLSARFLLPPDGLRMIELCFDMTFDQMELDPTPGLMDDFYEEYYDISAWFLSSFGARTGVDTPLYWGVGFGYSKETARANYTDSARGLGYPGSDSAFNESTVFQLKIGWDSGRHSYVELVYKWLLDSERNLDQMWNLVVGVYF